MLTINQGATSSISDLNIEGVIAYYKNLKILNTQQRERIAFDCTLSHLLTHINDALQTFLNDKTNQSILHHFTTQLQALMSKHPDINQHHHAELLITNTNALDNNGAINLIAFQEALKNFNRDSLTQSINSLVEHRYMERHSIMSHVNAIQNINNLHQLLLESAQDDSQNKANIIRAVSNSSFPGPPNIKHLLSNTNNTNVTDMKNKIVEILQTSQALASIEATDTKTIAVNIIHTTEEKPGVLDIGKERSAGRDSGGMSSGGQWRGYQGSRNYWTSRDGQHWSGGVQCTHPRCNKPHLVNPKSNQLHNKKVWTEEDKKEILSNFGAMDKNTRFTASCNLMKSEVVDTSNTNSKITTQQAVNIPNNQS